MDEAGSGQDIRGLVASSTSPRREREHYHGRLSWGGYQKVALGPLSQSAASGLNVYSIMNAFVSFIHFKYRQDKNHIFVRQQ